MNIFLSDLAAEQLDTLLTYLELEWSPRVRDNFLLKLDHAFNAIEKFPLGFPFSEKLAGLRKCVITPQTTAYYQVYENEIEIIAIFDNRMDL